MQHHLRTRRTAQAVAVPLDAFNAHDDGGTSLDVAPAATSGWTLTDFVRFRTQFEHPLERVEPDFLRVGRRLENLADPCDVSRDSEAVLHIRRGEDRFLRRRQ